MSKKYIILLSIIATLGAGVFVYQQIKIYDRVQNDINDVKKSVMLLESSNSEIETQLEFVGSLEFVEYIARTQLKYVMPDEIVFLEDESSN